MASPAVFVTGGNAGIGVAICKLLVKERGCKVFMGSRSIEKGQNAVKEMALGAKAGDITVVQCDVNVSRFFGTSYVIVRCSSISQNITV